MSNAYQKITAESRVLNRPALACLARPLAVFVCLLCPILPTSLFILDCASNFYLPVYLRDACCRVGERSSYKTLNRKYIFTHQSGQEQLKSLNTMATRLKRSNSKQTAASRCLEENDNPSRCGFKPHPGNMGMKLMVSASASRLLLSVPVNFRVSPLPRTAPSNTTGAK